MQQIPLLDGLRNIASVNYSLLCSVGQGMPSPACSSYPSPRPSMADGCYRRLGARLLRSLLFATVLTLSSHSLTDGEAVSADLVKPTVAAVLAILLLKERITIGMATSLGLRFVVSMHRS